MLASMDDAELAALERELIAALIEDDKLHEKIQGLIYLIREERRRRERNDDK